MTSDMLLIEQSVLDFFASHNKDVVDINELMQALEPTLSSNGKNAKEIFDQNLSQLPFVVIQQ